MNNVAAFATVATIRIVTPGAGAAVIIDTAVHHGRRAGIRAAAGCSVGIAVWGITIALGLGAVLRAHAEALRVIELVGIGYLGVLSIEAFRRALHSRATLARVNQTTGGKSAAQRGIIASLSNPSLPVFYLFIAPQFVTLHHNVASNITALALIDASICQLWYSSLLGLGGSVIDSLQRPTYAALMHIVSGSYFLFLAARLSQSV